MAASTVQKSANSIYSVLPLLPLYLRTMNNIKKTSHKEMPDRPIKKNRDLVAERDSLEDHTIKTRARNTSYLLPIEA